MDADYTTNGTIAALQMQIQELQSSLTEERVSNLELDTAKTDVQKQKSDLADLLAKEKLRNQELTQQLQDARIETDEKIQQLQQFIAQQHQQLQQLLHQQQQQEMSKQAAGDDDEYGKFDIKFDDEPDHNDGDDSVDSFQSDNNKELRHRLLEEQMRHEQLKHVHRQSITRITMKSGNTNATGSSTAGEISTLNDKLQAEISTLKRQLEDERSKRENLDKERRNSLAALSQNMFKKLLDSEHQHYDDKSDLEKQCNQLKLIIKHLEKSKQALLQQTSCSINELREHIKRLSNRLQQYEVWE